MGAREFPRVLLSITSASGAETLSAVLFTAAARPGAYLIVPSADGKSASLHQHGRYLQPRGLVYGLNRRPGHPHLICAFLLSTAQVVDEANRLILFQRQGNHLVRLRACPCFQRSKPHSSRYSAYPSRLNGPCHIVSSLVQMLLTYVIYYKAIFDICQLLSLYFCATLCFSYSSLLIRAAY